MRKTKKTPQKKQTRQHYTLDEKATAKEKYLRGLTLAEISVIQNVPIRTLEKWQLMEKWTSYKICPEIKARCLQLHRGGKTVKQISELVGKSIATVSRYIRAARNTEK